MHRLWGLTLPGAPFDTFGSKPNYSPDRPWLFEPFDQIVLNAVSREEFDEIHKQYRAGKYTIRSEESVFDLAEYDAMVERTKDEVREVKRLQEIGAAEELAKYAISRRPLRSWTTG